MKTIRLLSALAFASLLLAPVMRAEDAAAPTKPAAKAACGCDTGKDAKECGVDKDCCCNGTKATHANDKKDDVKKDDAKK